MFPAHHFPHSCETSPYLIAHLPSFSLNAHVYVHVHICFPLDLSLSLCIWVFLACATAQSSFKVTSALASGAAEHVQPSVFKHLQ